LCYYILITLYHLCLCLYMFITHCLLHLCFCILITFYFLCFLVLFFHHPWPFMFDFLHFHYLLPFCFYILITIYHWIWRHQCVWLNI
jgi:hypothetical protein